MQRRKPRAKVHVAVLVVASLVAFLAVCFVILLFGSVQGVEFSPQKFVARSFYYYQVPLLGIQIWPAEVTPIDSSLSSYVRKERLIGDVAQEPVRWDIATMNQFRGDASILTNYLEQKEAIGIESWNAWSKREPNMAVVFWPAVARLAHEELYAILPRLFELARSSKSAEPFKAELSRVIAGETFQQASAERVCGRLERALRIVEVGLSFSPDDSDLIKLRRELHQSSP